MDASTVSGPDQYRAARLAKADQLRAAGIEPFGNRFVPTHGIAAARALCPDQVADGDQPKGERVICAGRIGNLRASGAKLVFATLFDRSRADIFAKQDPALRDGADAKKARGIQLYLDKAVLGDGWAVVEALDLADWIGVEGRVGRTRRGEPSIFVERVTVLGKALLPPPHQAGADDGVLSPEIRQRQRYLDLMQSDAALHVFVTRSRLVAELRSFFADHGYLEVETPMMQPIPGGASARPFITRHNALGLDLYLRIAPELYLKRLLVGGLERVFELNRNFRNEGISPRHNPEFTMVEWYEAYADHRVMMDLSEALFRRLADRVLGRRTVTFGEWTIDLDQPFRRIGYHEALRQFGGIDHADVATVQAKARELEIPLAAHPTHDRLVNAVWEAVVEPHLIQPTFITDQPTWLTPLCRTHPGDPSRTLRFELFMARMEVGNAYTELNDPTIQRQRFAEQAAEAAAASDQEVSGIIDEDYCTALDHGLPCCGGQGLGIDRLVMLFTGATTIRDVILFPTMKPGA